MSELRVGVHAPCNMRLVIGHRRQEAIVAVAVLGPSAVSAVQNVSKFLKEAKY